VLQCVCLCVPASTYWDADDYNEDDDENIFWSFRLCCGVLQCVVAVCCCSVWQRVAVWCSDHDNEDDDEDVFWSFLVFVAVCCSVLQCVVAVQCSVVQCGAV